jgi:tetratricopeptide (TPR) repeat protein
MIQVEVLPGRFQSVTTLLLCWGKGITLPRETLVPFRTSALLLALVFLCPVARAAQQHEALHKDLRDLSQAPQRNTTDLPLPASSRKTVSEDLARRDFDGAERILIDAIHQNPKSPRLLTFLGNVYFLAGSYLECAVAMKKAEALAALSDGDRFLLAMSYVVLGHSDWAKPEIERLVKSEPGNALYYYWLSRVDYDLRFYAKGAAAGRRAVALKPGFVRAYDSVGLCEEALGHYQDAIRSYTKAEHLNLKAKPPSPWPPLELGTLYLHLNRFSDAKAEIEKALSLDPRFPEAHFRLGAVLEHEGNNARAEAEYKRAIALKPNFAGPHYALARLYGRLGKTKRAQAETAEFQKIRAKQRGLGIR